MAPVNGRCASQIDKGGKLGLAAWVMDQFISPADTSPVTPPEETENRSLALGYLSLLALGVGIVTGFGGVLFRALIVLWDPE